MEKLKIGLLLIGALTTIIYIIYQLLDTSIQLRREQLIESSKNFEKQIEKMIDVGNIRVLDKYRRSINDIVPTDSPFNIYMLILISLIFAIFAFDFSKNLFNQIVAGLLIALDAFAIPFFVIDIFVAYRRKAVRSHLPHFLLMFQQINNVVGDPFQALNMMKDKAKEPLRGYIKTFVKEINKGKDVEESINSLRMRSDNHVFRQFCDNLGHHMIYGYMSESSIDNDIQQAFTHEENYQHRITENTGSIVSIGMIGAMFILGVHRVLNINSEFSKILIDSSEGHFIVNIVIVIISAVILMVKKSINYLDN